MIRVTAESLYRRLYLLIPIISIGKYHFTLTVTTTFLEPERTVILAVPFFFAVSKPFLLTVHIFLFDVL